MKRIHAIFSVIALAFVCASAMAQGEAASNTEPQGTLVSVHSKGEDVREVLFDLFQQRGKSFVVNTGVFYNLFLNLEEVSFETALSHICRIAGLEYHIEDGIYIFSTAKSTGAPPSSPPDTTTESKQLDPRLLDKEITLRLSENEIRTVMRSITAKSGVPIEVAPNVPALKVNVYLTNTPVRDVLKILTKAAGLVWKETDRGTILVSKEESEPTVQVETTTATNITAAVAHCDQCGTSLKEGWKYCPVCGNYVEPHTRPKRSGGT